MMKVLAISGSLRRISSSALLRAAILLAPKGMEITLYEGLGSLPHFNPDLEGQEPPSVLDFRAWLQAADGVLICSPEYAHGVPGVLKNALDWVVGSGETVDKPFALLNNSSRSTHAQASLWEILKTMASRMISEASVTIPIDGKRLDAESIVTHPEFAPAIRQALDAFAGDHGGAVQKALKRQSVENKTVAGQV